MALPSSTISVNGSLNPNNPAATVSPIPLLASLGLSNITFMQELYGTYTPANDTLVVFNLGSQAEVQDCNFLLLLVSGPANIEIGSWYVPAGGIYQFATNNVNKIFLLSQASSTNNPIASLTLDGRSPQPQGFTPMAQGVPITYSVFLISADLS